MSPYDIKWPQWVKLKTILKTSETSLKTNYHQIKHYELSTFNGNLYSEVFIQQNSLVHWSILTAYGFTKTLIQNIACQLVYKKNKVVVVNCNSDYISSKASELAPTPTLKHYVIKSASATRPGEAQTAQEITQVTNWFSARGYIITDAWSIKCCMISNNILI